MHKENKVAQITQFPFNYIGRFCEIKKNAKNVYFAVVNFLFVNIKRAPKKLLEDPTTQELKKCFWTD